MSDAGLCEVWPTIGGYTWTCQINAEGYCSDSRLLGLGLYGTYWSSTPYSGNSVYAWSLYFFSSDISRNDYGRHYGQSVRPVRGFAE